jgi:DNA-binding XRE family transcriptional regulator
MPEYGRLLADKYRARHGLLTSDEIRKRRRRLELTQEQFATHLGVGIASIKRWEMGKIQDLRNNQLIVERTRPPVTDVWELAGDPGPFVPIVTSTSNISAQESAIDVFNTACRMVRGTPSVTELGAEPSSAVQEYIEALPGSVKRSVPPQQTGLGWPLFHFEPQHQTVNPQFSWIANESEEFAYA